MTYAATYNRIRHLPDVQYDITSWATTVGNALPAVAFPSRNRHTTVFTGPYPGPEGLDTQYTSISSTKRSWLCYHRDIWAFHKYLCPLLKGFKLFMGIPFPIKGWILNSQLYGPWGWDRPFRWVPLGLPLGSSLGSSLGAAIVNTSMCITMQIQVKFSCVTLPFTGLGWGDVRVSVCNCTVSPQGSPQNPQCWHMQEAC